LSGQLTGKAAEKDLQTLLCNMDPVLEPTTYVFVTLDDEQLNHHLADCLMVFREREGTTLIMEQCKADSRGLDSSFPCKRITLQIHSALEAVGFLAAVIPSLAGAGMGQFGGKS